MTGFFLRAGDSLGECITADDGLTDSQSKRLDFGDKLTLSCSVTVNTLEEFKELCNDTEKRQKLRIFDQFLSNFKYLGIFGNPAPHKNGDWAETEFEASTENFGRAGNYEELKNSCKNFTSSLEVEIFHSYVGSPESGFQDYIINGRVSAVEHEWIFNPTAGPQKFSFFASVSFRKYLSDTIKEQMGTSTLDMIRGKLFYPL